MPPFFQDDWLNDYYDAKSGAASDAAADAAGLHSLHQPAAALCVQRRGSDGAVLAAGDACDAAATPADAAAGPIADVAAAPASCIATSDYRFVYLGPKVQASLFLSALHSADLLMGHTECLTWCCLSVSSCTPT